MDAYSWKSGESYCNFNWLLVEDIRSYWSSDTRWQTISTVCTILCLSLFYHLITLYTYNIFIDNITMGGQTVHISVHNINYSWLCIWNYYRRRNYSIFVHNINYSWHCIWNYYSRPNSSICVHNMNYSWHSVYEITMGDQTVQSLYITWTIHDTVYKITMADQTVHLLHITVIQ